MKNKKYWIVIVILLSIAILYLIPSYLGKFIPFVPKPSVTVFCSCKLGLLWRKDVTITVRNNGLVPLHNVKVSVYAQGISITPMEETFPTLGVGESKESKYNLGIIARSVSASVSTSEGVYDSCNVNCP